MSSFFIHRPIFAWVIAILITLVGVLVLPNAAVEQYPDVAPPKITIRANYPGASAEEVARTVTSVIEDELNGADGLLYYESKSTSTGQSQIDVTFEPGTNDDIAQVQVQNRASSVESSLPQSVLDQGITYNKGNSNFLMLITMTSPNGTYSKSDLSDYIARNIQNDIARVKGVGYFQLFGSERALRVWFDNTKLTALGMTAADVRQALATQNVQIPAGSIGAPPTPSDQQTSAIVSLNGQLSTPEQFENLVLRTGNDGSTVRIKDVATVEIGDENYQYDSRLNGHSSTAFAISLKTGANALETEQLILDKMHELEQYFPADMEWSSPYNTAPYVAASIEQVLHTLVEAIVLVFIVMFIFLQNVRYTIIPAMVVPVALLGTLAVLHYFGYSVNMLTMFAMVLAIGILVDDAIVVVENVERIMSEEGLSPVEATIKSMPEIQGAIVGITCVLVVVFLPLMFMAGSSGVIYRQFAMAMMVSIAFSAFLALSFTPALCATILKPVAHGERKGFFGWFNRNFDKLTEKYKSVVVRMLKRSWLWMIVYVVLTIAMIFMFIRLPSSFMPIEDQGYVIANVELPSGSSVNRTDKILKQAEDYFMHQDEVENVIAVRGFSFNGSGYNAGIMFVPLKDFEDRPGAEHGAEAVAGRATGALLFGIPDATIFSLVPPAISSLGNSAGFDLRLQDRGSVGVAQLRQYALQLVALANQSPVLKNVRITGLSPGPTLKVTIDRGEVYRHGLNMADVSTVINASMGGSYINKFPNMGRMQQVWIQAKPEDRVTPEDILKLRVANKDGQLVDVRTFATVKWTEEPNLVNRYNSYYAQVINGEAAPGYSNGEAMDELKRLIAENLPNTIGYEWSALSYQELQAGNQAPFMMALSIIVVFLVLAALYESWAIPLAAILIIPLGMFGTIALTWLRGMSNDIYFQIGMITVIGLATKNAILIVEFAKDQVAAGGDLLESTIEGARLRFRPILMTSFAFILGVLPLLFTSAAGAASQHAVGTGVVGGMLGATPFSIFFVPIFFVVVLRFFKTKPKNLRAQAQHANGATTANSATSAQAQAPMPVTHALPDHSQDQDKPNSASSESDADDSKDK
ncbi:multidrug efflux RND transporter permease subunit [Brackiella oedipodis]|uniref:multidrug efflux RND transporter permease subunit n=1 Tax=Brackiella oedipodis TaxID=124225 RepID=UPI000685A540|nr:multidrug efflux RND transporter permease subunit [Brackiella oedipodis]